MEKRPHLLKKETLKRLTETELDAVAGGEGDDPQPFRHSEIFIPCLDQLAYNDSEVGWSADDGNGNAWIGDGGVDLG
jgi:hypothetical protein